VQYDSNYNGMNYINLRLYDQKTESMGA